MAENNEPHGAAVNLDMTGSDDIIELTDVVEPSADGNAIELTDVAGAQGDGTFPQPVEIAADSPVVDRDDPFDMNGTTGETADDTRFAPVEIAADSPVGDLTTSHDISEAVDEAGDDVIELTEVAADSQVIDDQDSLATSDSADDAADDDIVELTEVVADDAAIDEEEPLGVSDTADDAADDDILELTEVAADDEAIDDEGPLAVSDSADDAADDDILELTEVAADSQITDAEEPPVATETVDDAGDDANVGFAEVTADTPVADDELFDLVDSEDDAAVEEMIEPLTEPAGFADENSVLDEEELFELSGITETLEDDGAYTLPGLASDDDEFSELTNELDLPTDDAIIDLSEVADDSVPAEELGSHGGSQPVEGSANDEFTELPELLEAGTVPNGADEEAFDGAADQSAEELETLVFPDSSAGTMSESAPPVAPVEIESIESEPAELQSPEADQPLNEPETLLFPDTSATADTAASSDDVNETMESDQDGQEENREGGVFGIATSSIDGFGGKEEEDATADDKVQEKSPDEVHEDLIGLIQDEDHQDEDGFHRSDETVLNDEDLVHTETQGQESDGHLLDPDEEVDIPPEDATIEDHEAGSMFAESLEDDLDVALSVSNEDGVEDEAEFSTDEDKAGVMSVQIENKRDDGLVDFKFESRLHPGDKVYKEKERGLSDVAVSQEQVENAVRQVVREMLSDKIDSVLDDIIKKTIVDEIKKIKDMLLKE